MLDSNCLGEKWSVVSFSSLPPSNRLLFTFVYSTFPFAPIYSFNMGKTVASIQHKNL